MVEAEVGQTVGSDVPGPQVLIQPQVLDDYHWGGEHGDLLGHRSHIIGIQQTT
jgi:hypothetical protein